MIVAEPTICALMRVFCSGEMEQVFVTTGTRWESCLYLGKAPEIHAMQKLQFGAVEPAIV
ncbi:hypothetical protein VWX35_00250 [Phaeobacter sp. A36a-5a]|uniref:hypothetical protein n=1 Tax=Phaeobacter bryozoorum TaxID=1086632 RepID=UPI0035A6AE47